MGKLLKFNRNRHLRLVGGKVTGGEEFKDMDYSPERLAEIREKLETINNLMSKTLGEDNNDY